MWGDIFVVLLIPICSLGNLEMDLLVILILSILVIWINGGLSQVIFSPLVVVLIARKEVCRLPLLCLLLKLNIWLFGWEFYNLNFVGSLLALLYNVISRMQFVWLQIRCFIKKQSILIWDIFLIEVSLLKVALRYAR